MSIADDAYKVAFYITFDNGTSKYTRGVYTTPGLLFTLTLYNKEPTTQSEFTEQIVQNITEVEPGHQCYKIASLPSTASAGTNATIQLAYWADYEGENGGKNETFYACADVVSHPQYSQFLPSGSLTLAIATT